MFLFQQQAETVDIVTCDQSVSKPYAVRGTCNLIQYRFYFMIFQVKDTSFFLIILQVSVTYSCYTNLSWLLPVIGEKVNGHTTHRYLPNSTEGGYTTDDGIFTLSRICLALLLPAFFLIMT